MPQSIMAIYEHGLLRPLEPLILPENQKVLIHVLTEPVVDKTDQIIQHLVKIGLLTPSTHPIKTPLISKAERRKLADALAHNAKRSLSEIVIEERGQW